MPALVGIRRPAIIRPRSCIELGQVLALAPQLLFDPGQPNVAFVERTGASATTPAVDGSLVGSYKNLGTLGGWVTAPSDGARPTYTGNGGLPYLAFAGAQVLSAALNALRGVSGWTIVAGTRRNTSSALNRVVVTVMAGASARAYIQYLITTNLLNTGGRRNNADAGQNVSGLTHNDVDIVASATGNYTNTDLFLRCNGAQEGASTSWLTAGATPNDEGFVNLGATGPSGSPINYLHGRLARLAIVPAVLVGGDLALFERWAGEGSGISF